MKASAGFTGSTFLAAVMGLVLSSAHAVPMIVNGGFESGFASWTRAAQLGSEGTFAIQTGTTSPVLGFPVPPPPGGTNAAMTDAEGPGSHVLYQDFLVTSGSAKLSFALFIGNRAISLLTGDPLFVTPTPATLDFATPALNQQARVDILRAGTDPFSVAAADVLLNLFQTTPGDPLVDAYSIHTIDVSALFAANIGQTLRLRFAEVDNVGPFQLGVDDVNIAAAVPAPASTLLFGVALAALLGIRSRRARQ